MKGSSADDRHPPRARGRRLRGGGLVGRCWRIRIAGRPPPLPLPSLFLSIGESQRTVCAATRGRGGGAERGQRQSGADVGSGVCVCVLVGWFADLRGGGGRGGEAL